MNKFKHVYMCDIYECVQSGDSWLNLGCRALAEVNPLLSAALVFIDSL